MMSKTKAKVARYSVKAKVKLTNAKPTQEPQSIIAAKKQLKETKQFTTSLSEITSNLYNSQKSQSILLKKLCSTLTSVQILDINDKFGIFLNNMGRVKSNLEEIYEMYLINMKDQLIIPLNNFNKNDIQNCQKIKLKLKTLKGQYDIKKKSESKLLDKQTTKNINLSKIHLARSASALKLDDLSSIRNEFLKSIESMESSKLLLLNNIKAYFNSYNAFAKIHASNLKIQNKMMFVMPPDIDINKLKQNKTDLLSLPGSPMDSDNDIDDQQSTFSDWGATSIIVRQGWMKKKGEINKKYKKRYFKLFTNKKLAYYTSDKNGKCKGHANLNNIIELKKIKKNVFTIETKTRLWTFQCDNNDRDDWYNAIEITCMKNKAVSIMDTANNFGDMFLEDEEMEYDGANGNSNLNQKQLQQFNDNNNKKDDDDDDDDGDDDPIAVQVAMQAMRPQASVPDSSFVGISMKFKVNVLGIGLYEDEKLTSEVFSVQLQKDDVVNGKYINSKVILLEKQQLHISTMDVIEINDDNDNDNEGKDDNNPFFNDNNNDNTIIATSNNDQNNPFFNNDIPTKNVNNNVINNNQIGTNDNNDNNNNVVQVDNVVNNDANNPFFNDMNTNKDDINDNNNVNVIISNPNDDDNYNNSDGNDDYNPFSDNNDDNDNANNPFFNDDDNDEQPQQTVNGGLPVPYDPDDDFV